MVIDEVFESVVGKPCWQVRLGYGSFLTCEFGQPQLVVDQPRQRTYRFSRALQTKLPMRSAYVRGDWHLWIYCCAWSLHYENRRLAHSESAKKRIEQSLHLLNGQALVAVSVEPSNARTLFTFDLGCTLRTWPYDADSDQWMLFEPSGNVLTVRADGRYSHAPGNSAPELHSWLPLQS